MDGCEVGPPRRVIVEPGPTVALVESSAPASPLPPLTVTITADTSGFERALWGAWYRIVRNKRQPSDENPMPRLRLFRRSTKR